LNVAGDGGLPRESSASHAKTPEIVVLTEDHSTAAE
jgi:hypothetical protein